MLERSYGTAYFTVKIFAGKNAREEEFSGSAAGIRA
jgi:hypothetical protein